MNENTSNAHKTVVSQGISRRQTTYKKRGMSYQGHGENRARHLADTALLFKPSPETKYRNMQKKGRGKNVLNETQNLHMYLHFAAGRTVILNSLSAYHLQHKPNFNPVFKSKFMFWKCERDKLPNESIHQKSMPCRLLTVTQGQAFRCLRQKIQLARPPPIHTN